MWNPSRERLAYAAGLFEGEGCVSLQRRDKNPNLILAISMTDLEPLEKFWAAIGGLGQIIGPYKGRGPNPNVAYRDRWIWQCTKREHCHAILYMLWPWLGPRRQARAAQAINTVAAWAEPL